MDYLLRKQLPSLYCRWTKPNKNGLRNWCKNGFCDFCCQSFRSSLKLRGRYRRLRGNFGSGDGVGSAPSLHISPGWREIFLYRWLGSLKFWPAPSSYHQISEFNTKSPPASNSSAQRLGNLQYSLELVKFLFESCLTASFVPLPSIQIVLKSNAFVAVDYLGYSYFQTEISRCTNHSIWKRKKHLINYQNILKGKDQ